MEEKQASPKSDDRLAPTSSEGNHSQGDGGGVQRPLSSVEKSESRYIAPEPRKIMTNQEFLESKLYNCKRFVENIDCLKETTLLKQFQDFRIKDILEYMIWMNNTKRTIEMGISELFALHKLDINKLKKEEYDKIRAYFICFQTLVHS
jgi:hypothetical protein